jgi:hypothetical protein
LPEGPQREWFDAEGEQTGARPGDARKRFGIGKGVVAGGAGAEGRSFAVGGKLDPPGPHQTKDQSVQEPRGNLGDIGQLF